MTDRICTDLSALRPEVERIAHVWAHICKDDLGIEIKVLETLRTRERQEALQADGKSQVKLGWHQFGYAIDFACFRNGVYVTDGNNRLYEKCGQVAEALDFVWGGRWIGLRDSGHIEWHPGFTLQQMLDGAKDGQVVL